MVGELVCNVGTKEVMRCMQACVCVHVLFVWEDARECLVAVAVLMEGAFDGLV